MELENKSHSDLLELARLGLELAQAVIQSFEHPSVNGCTIAPIDRTMAAKARALRERAKSL